MASNELFKLVSLRGAAQVSEEATAGVNQTELYRLFNEHHPNLKVLDKSITSNKSKKFFKTMTSAAVQKSTIAKMESELSPLTKVDFDKLNNLKIRVGDKQLKIRELVSSPVFKEDMSGLSDTWLLIRSRANLKNKKNISVVDLSKSPNISLVEKLLRVGWLAQRFAQEPGKFKHSETIHEILNLRIVYPRKWRTSYIQNLQHVDKPPKKQGNKDADDGKISKIDQLQEDYKILTLEIKNIENIHNKAVAAYSSVFNKTPGKLIPDRRSPDVVQNGKLIGEKFPPAQKDKKSKSTSVLSRLVDGKAFESTLGTLLNSEEKDTLKGLDFKIAKELPVSLESALEQLNRTRDNKIKVASDLCSEIRVWEDEVTLPDTRSKPEPITDANRPSIRAIGLGDLIVAREKLVGYEANEIAHIENVLPKEERLREHERTTTRKEVTETETFTEKSSEKDLQTTDRSELQTQSQKAINQQFSVNAGVNVSGKYGVTSVSASLQAGFTKSVNESKSSSTNIAKEIVSKAVESVRESTREIRQVTTSEEIRELNKHGITGTDNAFSGVYYWVDKVHEIELRHYGTRLMIEFYIPEPGVSFLPKNNTQTQGFKKPAPFALKPKDIQEYNYLCLGALYGASGIEPPPPQKIQVGYEWASTPEKIKGETPNVSSNTNTIQIPEGYVPAYATITFSTSWFLSKSTMEHDKCYVSAFVDIGGTRVISSDHESHITQEMVPLVQLPAPHGLPMTVLVTGASNKAATINIRVTCLRTTDAMQIWRMKVYECIKEAYE